MHQSFFVLVAKIANAILFVRQISAVDAPNKRSV